MFNLPPLSFEYSALEPFIDAKTMEIHHTKHHQGYINKLNAALEGYPDFQSKGIVDLLKGWSGVPDEIKEAVRNNGGGHHNHSLFWSILTPNQTEIPEGLLNAINSSFGTLDAFKEQFAQAAGSRFGSGWAWLVLEGETLKVISTPNQDSPLMDGLIPLLGLDVWEHAYYLNYQNKRGDYVENFWKIVNWEQVAQYYQDAS
jgi:Fe-Mn family superoxide dismutase